MSPVPRQYSSAIDEPVLGFLKRHKNKTLGDIRNHLKKQNLEYTENSKGLEKRIKKLVELKKIKKTYRLRSYPYYNIGKKKGGDCK